MFSTIIWVGFSQSLFAALLMFTKKESSVSDKILSAWLTLLAIEFFTCALDYMLFDEPLLSSSFLLFNPAMFLYVKSLTRPNFQLHWTQLLHLLPFIVFETLAYIINEPISLNLFFAKDNNLIFRLVFAIANFVSWAVYNPLSIMLVHKHRMYLRNEQSNIGVNENLGWVLGIVIFYFVYCSVAVILGVVVLIDARMPMLPHVYNYSALLIGIYILGFYGLRQQSLPEKMVDIDKHAPSYKNSMLSREDKEHIKNKLITHVEQNQLYLNSDLNMDMLASALKIPKYQITEVLNTIIGKNFFQFVNGYRVEEVKKMLVDPHNNFSVEAIGYDCGFSSKSSFYKEFRRIVGMTPVEYKNAYGG